MTRHEFGTGSDRVVVDTEERCVLTSDGRRITEGIEAVAGDTTQLRAWLAGVRGVVPDSMAELWGDATRRKLVIFDGHLLYVYAISSPLDEEAAARVVDAVNRTWPRTRPFVSPPPSPSTEGVVPTITPEMARAARLQLAITYGLVFFVAVASLVLGIALQVPSSVAAGLALGVLGFLIRRRSATALGIAIGLLAVDALLNLVASPSLWAGVGLRVAILVTMVGGFGAIRTLKQANTSTSNDLVLTTPATPPPGVAPTPVAAPAAAAAVAVAAPPPVAAPVAVAAPPPVAAPATVAWPVQDATPPARAKGRRRVLVGVAAGALVLTLAAFVATQLTDTTRPKTRAPATNGAALTLGDLELGGTWQTRCYHYEGKPWISLTRGTDSVLVLLVADGASVEQVSGDGSAYNFAWVQGVGPSDAVAFIQDDSTYTITGEAYDFAHGNAIVPFTVTATCAAWD